MIYCDLDTITEAIANTEENSELETLGALARVYFNALHNPPDGVIGVGAISYAEAMLVDHQLKLADA